MFRLRVKNETIHDLAFSPQKEAEPDNEMKRGPRFIPLTKIMETIQDETIQDEDTMSNAGEESEIKILGADEIAIDLEANAFGMVGR